MPALALTPRTKTLLGVLVGSWAAYALVLVLLIGLAPITRFLGLKFAITLAGLACVYVALVGRGRWQPCVLAPAVAFLALHGLVMAAIFFREGVNSESVWSMLTTRVDVLQVHLSNGTTLSTSIYAIEQLVMPVVQFVVAVIAVVKWRAPPSNSTPHTDARASSVLDQPSSARAGGRGR